ncbi:MBOAT family O-acyltransferase [candidate division CSSED10-310 bacterium]|uniref:MBOAT family O-acyltransferase n=1 Tax=candidate division CSSED10-310 bacterium TaxID=2855610 RepID=A0ABV6Z421_UNCC1
MDRVNRKNYYLNGLLMLSLIFYGWHVPEYLLIILTCVLTNYVAGRLLSSIPLTHRVARQVVIAAVICINVGLLAYFKYAAFLVDLFCDLFGYKIPSNSLFSALDIVLPIGISFYTFQSLSYTIDVYRGQQAAERSLARFALFVAFFPQLIAGPIVRANQFFYQLSRKRRVRWSVFMEGCYLILRGLFLKLVIADNLGQVVDRYWTAGTQPDAPATLALSLVVLFSCQIFCDFAGYTDIARGIAYQLGFRLPKNFNAPYLAQTFSDFWKRWHITLSLWIRDYLYIPFGGSRGSKLNTCRNLLIVFVLSGLWHGAGINFILWGALHGFAILIEHATALSTWLERNKSRPIVTTTIAFAWFLVVQGTWIMGMALFRASDGAEAWLVLQKVVSGVVALPLEGLAYPESKGLITAAWWFTTPVWLIHVRVFLQERFKVRQSIYERTIYAGMMIYAVLTLYASNPKFIYFQF